MESKVVCCMLIFYLNRFVSSAEYYVVLNDDDCSYYPDECGTLQYYTSSETNFFTSNASFYFSEGPHVLDTEKSLMIVNVQNLSLVGLGETEEGFHNTVMQSTSIITCETPSSNVVFMNSTNITIRSITFRNCGRILELENRISNYFKNALSLYSSLAPQLGSNATVVTIEVYQLTIQNVSVQNSSGYGLLSINSFSIYIAQSSFVENNLRAYYEHCEDCIGGNLAIFYTNILTSVSLPIRNIHPINIINTNVSFGINLAYPRLNSQIGGGMLIFMEQTRQYGIYISIDNIVAHGNTAAIGANLAFVSEARVPFYTLLVQNTVSKYANIFYKLDSSFSFYMSGGGMAILSGCANRLQDTNSNSAIHRPSRNPIRLYNAEFYYNNGGASGTLTITYYGKREIGELHNVFIENVTMHSNHGEFVSGMVLSSQVTGVGNPIIFNVKNVSIFNNSFADLAAVKILTCHRVNFELLNVQNNRGSGLLVQESTIYFYGNNNLLMNNTGVNGGGLHIGDNSLVVLELPAMVYILNNHATKTGGGMYIKEDSNIIDCFFHFTAIPEERVIGDNGFYFENNTANISGTVVYGGNIDECNPIDYTFEELETSTKLFDEFFEFPGEGNSNVSAISSKAIKVCFCNGLIPNCSLDNIRIEVYPGEKINVSVVTVGQRNGTTPGRMIVSEIVNKNLIHQYFEYTPSACYNFTSLVNTFNSITNNSQVVLSTDISELSPLVNRNYITIHMDILDCPLGFEISDITGSCDCCTKIRSASRDAVCNISTMYIQREGDVWIGSRNETNLCVIAHTNCPLNYCDTSNVTFSITDPSPQCAFQRTGLLCGKCTEGYSLVLGGNECSQCSNWYLLLLIVFGLAGFCLVALIIILNLTVSVGTLDALIFYVNVVKLNELALFPLCKIPFLTYFISWLNLDLGINTCFYNGMDGYMKAWLQFLFPFYLWFVIIVVIVFARHYSPFARVIGKTAVPALATLLLLSYNKLFRSIALVFTVIPIKCDNELILSWYADPNIHYLSTEHTIIFVFSLLVLFLLGIPFTAMLLFRSPIERYLVSHLKCIKPQMWLKVKPFLDAYGGPYKDNYQFWVGLLLVARLFIILFVSLFSNSKESILTFTISIAAILLAISTALNGVYKNWYLNVLQIWFLLTIIVHCSAALNDNAFLGTVVAVSVTFFIFVGIIIFHIHLKYKNSKPVRSLLVRISSSIRSNKDQDEVANNPIKTIDATDIRERFVDSTESIVVLRRESLIFENP